MPDTKENSKYLSDSELHVSWWLEDLLLNGYIIYYKYEPYTIEAGKDITVSIKYTKKGKQKTKKKVIKQSVKYTPDFKVKWSNKALGIFIYNEDTVCLTSKPLVYNLSKDMITYLEVKPDFDHHNMTRSASSKIKLITYCTNKNIIIVKPTNLFKSTFTPSRFIFTNSGDKKRKRKMKHQPIMLDDYIKTITDDSNN